MKKTVLLIFCAFLLHAPVRAEEEPLGHSGLFANGKEIFHPLLADPREVQLALRLVTPVGKKNLGEVAIGNYFGLYRWELPWEKSYIQWSIAGGVFARFDLVSEEKDLQVADYIAEMPIDIRVQKWSMRILPYHLSSHLGDDFLKRTGTVTSKYTFDAYKTLMAYEPVTWLRLYGGFTYIIRNGQDQLGRYALQTGAEWTSPWWAHRHAQTFWATDLQSWERIGWNPTVNTQLGIRFARAPEDKQNLAIFTEYGAGHQIFGQFFQLQESHWVLVGLRFELM